MSGQLAAAEPYVTRFETEVNAVDGTRVWLETSYFFAASGGQPTDRGSIGDVAIEDVTVEDGEHVHILTEEPSFRAGTRVMCHVDWKFRMYCMRAHTAAHLLVGAARRTLEDVTYAGATIGTDRITVDLETAAEPDAETLIALNELINEAVWDSLPVYWDDIEVAEAREREDVTFTDATEPEAVSKGRVRIVTVGEHDHNGRSTAAEHVWDIVACGGTHVRNTREVGPLTVLDWSQPNPGTIRFALAVGPAAIERMTAEKRVALSLESNTDASLETVAEHGTAIEEAAGAASPDATAGDPVLEAIGQPTGSSVVGVVEEVSPEHVSEVVRAVLGERADRIAIVGVDDYTFAVVGCTDAIDASAVVRDMTRQFGGGGGGSTELAQGGGFEEPPNAVAAWLEDRFN